MQDDLEALGTALWRDARAARCRDEAAQDLRHLVSHLKARGFSPSVTFDRSPCIVTVSVNLDEVELITDGPIDSAAE